MAWREVPMLTDKTLGTGGYCCAKRFLSVMAGLAVWTAPSPPPPPAAALRSVPGASSAEPSLGKVQFPQSPQGGVLVTQRRPGVRVALSKSGARGPVFPMANSLRPYCRRSAW